MSDAQFGTVITAVASSFTMMTTLVMAYFMAKLKARTEADAAERAIRAGIEAEERKIRAEAEARDRQRVLKTLEESTRKAAQEAENVKKVLEATTTKQAEELNYIKSVADKTHVLVDGGMLAQKKITSMLAKRVTQMSDSTPEDEEIAKVATEAFEEHSTMQELLDEKTDDPLSSIKGDEVDGTA